MKLRFVHIFFVVLLSFTLTGCRDMFYREVDFKVDGEKEQLVLLSQLRVYDSVYTAVRHTFVMDPSSPATSPGSVPDATVAYRINTGAWIPLAPTADTAYYRHAGTSAAPVLHPLDTVEIEASHPVYGDVRSRQIMPDTVGASITSWAIDNRNGWVNGTLHLDAYHGNANDRIGIVMYEGELVLTNNNTGSITRMPIELLYSTHAVFAQANNLQTDGYYGAIMSERAGGTALYYPLFVPAAAIGEGVDIALLLDARVKDKIQDLTNYTLSLSKVSLGLYAMTEEAYQQSLFARTYGGIYLPSPSGIPGSSYNYVDMVLQALSSALGRQEGISPYTNIDGGLGYFIGLSFQTIPLNQ